MFSFLKKDLILVSATIASIGNLLPNSECFIENPKNCLLLSDQKCSVKKVIIDNDYMTFPYKIKVDRCIGSCNNVNNPYYKVWLPDVFKNISVKAFDLISPQNELRSMNFMKVATAIVY